MLIVDLIRRYLGMVNIPISKEDFEKAVRDLYGCDRLELILTKVWSKSKTIDTVFSTEHCYDITLTLYYSEGKYKETLEYSTLVDYLLN